MKIYFATDHAGFELKNKLMQFVRDDMNIDVEDCGAYEYNTEDDYPLFVAEAMRKISSDISKGIDSRAVIIGGSGQGEAIVANKFKGVRAVVYYGGSQEIITLSREDNDANTLSLGARFINNDDATSIVRLFLTTDFSNNERHMRRIAQIESLT